MVTSSRHPWRFLIVAGRRPPRRLSVRQRQAAELLAGGLSDQQTAEAVGASRRSVSRWKASPPFWFEVLRLRQASWAAGRVRLLGLLGRALDVISAALAAEGPERLAVALKVVELSA